MKIKFFVLLLFSFTSFSLIAQEIVIKGKVTSITNGEPVVGASVYFPNTTLGTSTNINGDFEITTTHALPINLNISSIGFKTKVLEITNSENLTLHVVMEEHVNMLDEVVINSHNTTWEEFGPDFIKSFIGYSNFAKQIEIVNTEDLKLYFNNKTRTLSVKSKKPIIIINKALGYKITYWLEDFKKSYTTKGILSYRGFPFFEDLTKNKSVSKRRRNKWIKNRISAYNGSLMHFIRSVYNNTSNKEGFKVDNVVRVPVRDYYKRKVATIDTIFYNNKELKRFYNLMAKTNPRIARIGIENLKKWKRDSTRTDNFKLSYFSTNHKTGKTTPKVIELEKDKLNPKKIIAVEYPIDPKIKKKAKNGFINVVTKEAIDTSEFLAPNSSLKNSKKLSIENVWQVTYQKENEERAYQQRQLWFKKFKKKKQVSFIYKHPSTSQDMIIFKDGNYHPNSILTEGYWSFEKIDKLLPLDYKLEKN